MNILYKITANRFMQRKIFKRICKFENCLGIGTGAGVGNSGELKVLQNLQLSANTVVLDVGSNVGQYASTVLKLYPELELHCFEPCRKNVAILEDKFQSKSNVTINPFGLSSSETTLTMHGDVEGSGLGSVYDRDLSEFNMSMDYKESCDFKTLDSYIKEQGIDRIDLLKIDVEGHELDVFKGAEHLLRSGMVSHIQFEFGGTNIDSRTFFRDFWKLLTPLGYKLFRITPTGYLSWIKGYSERLERFTTTNFIARLEQ